MAACSIEDDYETLSFWFDGVPTPEEQAAERARLAAGPDEPVAAPGGVVRSPRVRPSLPEGFSRHEPYAQQDCGACHEIEARGNFFGGVPKLRFPQGELCVQCHEPEDGAYVHGPSASGACSICHVPHQSNFPALRRFEKLDSLCLECHTDEYFLTRDQHRAWEGQECVSCHDPHASERPALLREPKE